MIDAADSWLNDAWADRQRLGASFLVGFICIHLRQDFVIFACAWGVAYIVVGMLADLLGLVDTLHDCVHDAAREAQAELRELQRAEALRRHESATR